MAVIPDIRYARATPEVVKQPAVQSPLEAIGGAIQGVGDVVLKSELKEQETQFMADFAAFQVQAEEEFNRIGIERQNNPDGFGDTYLETIDKHFDQMKQGKGYAYQEAATQRYAEFRANRAMKAAGFEADLKTTVQRNRIEGAAINLQNLVYQDPSYLPQAIKELEGNFTAAKAVALMPDAPEALRKAKSRMAYSAFSANADKGRLGAAKQYLSPDALGEYYERANADYIAAGKRIEAETRARSAEVREGAKQFNDLLKSGVVIGDKDIAELESSAVDDKSRNAVAAVRSRNELVKQLRSATVQDVDNYLKEAVEPALTGDAPVEQKMAAAEQYEFVSTFRTRMAEQIKKNNLDWAAEGGANLADWKTNLGERVKQAEAVKEKFGGEKKVLRDHEADELAKMVSEMRDDQAASFLSNLTKGVDAQTASIIAGQIAPKNAALAAAAAMAKYDITVTRDIISGAKQPSPLPSDDKFMSSVIAETRNTLTPDGYAQVMPAIKALYAQSMAKGSAAGGQKIDSSLIDDSTLKEAIRRVLPPTDTLGAGSAIGYQDPDTGAMVSVGQVLNTLEGLNSGSLSAAHDGVPLDANMRPVSVEQLLSGAEFVSVGNGKYTLKNKDFYYMDRTGKPFVLDMVKLKKIDNGIKSMQPTQRWK